MKQWHEYKMLILGAIVIMMSSCLGQIIGMTIVKILEGK